MIARAQLTNLALGITVQTRMDSFEDSYDSYDEIFE
jgi:hypothetical protein